MITESGRVMAVDNDHVWVETLNQSTCGSCAAEKGCGQSLLAKWSARQAYLKVSLAGRKPDSIRVNDPITIGVPEDVVLKSALLLYSVPLVLLILGAVLGQSWLGSDAASITGGLLGLVLGGGLVSFVSRWLGHHRRYQPVIVEMMASTAGEEVAVGQDIMSSR